MQVALTERRLEARDLALHHHSKEQDVTKIIAEYLVPDGISDELAAGIHRYADRIAALGGYGTRIRATMPNGVVIEGELIELGGGSCQPGICDDSGRRYHICDLAAVEVQS